MSAVRAAPQRRSLLHEQPGFRRLWVGQSLSMVGDQVSYVALPLVAVLTLDAGAAEMGGLAAAGLLPNLLVSLHAGAWVDRRGRRRRTMLAADLARAGVLATVPLAALFGALTLAHLYAVAFAVGTLGVVFTVAYTSVFAALVPEERYVEANQLLYGSRSLSYAAGPSAGGLLVQVATAPVALVLDALSFLGSALCLRGLHVDEPPPAPPEDGGVRAGLAFLRATPTMRTLLASTAIVNLGTAVFTALFVLFCTRELGLAAGELGLVLAAGAAGGLLGAVVAGRLARRVGLGAAFAAGTALFAAPLLAAPLIAGSHLTVLLLVAGLEIVSGFGVMVLDVSVGALVALLVPNELRSRVSGAYMLVNFGVRPVGAVGGGVLGSVVGVRQALGLGAVVAVCAVLPLVRSPVLRLEAGRE